MKAFFLQFQERQRLIFFTMWGGFFLYVWPRMFFVKPDGIYAGERSIWGDWAGHMAATAVFAYRPIAFWFKNHPQFYGHIFNYPFATSMISGFLMRAGLDPVSAMVLPSILTSFLLLAALYLFYRDILKSARQAYAAVTLFFFSGGMGFIYYFQDVFKAGTLKAAWFPMREYTYLEDKLVFFRNVFPGELLPQRSFLLGLPVALLLLWVLMHWLSRDRSDNPQLWKYVLLGLPAGLMMVIHTHSYMVLVMLCLCLGLSDMRSYRQLLAFALGAGVVSLWLYLSLFGKTIHSNWFGVEWGWMASRYRGGIFKFILFWLLNWGLVLPLALWGTIRLRYYRHPMVMGGWLLFVLCNFIRFQPWNWDNSKLLTWSYLLLLIPVAGILGLLWRRPGRLPKCAAIACMMLMMFSGGLELMRLVHVDRPTYRMWDTPQIEMAAKLRGLLKPTDTVLTDDGHLNWVSCLAGGQILMGFRGWLWSYGINYSEREKDIRSMYSGNESADVLFKKYHVHYAVLTPAARKDFGANDLLFLMKYHLMMSSNDIRVFDVTTSGRN